MAKDKLCLSLDKQRQSYQKKVDEDAEHNQYPVGHVFIAEMCLNCNAYPDWIVGVGYVVTLNRLGGHCKEETQSGRV